MKKLRIGECLNFCNAFLDRANTATSEDLLNALFRVSYYFVKSTCSPDTDHETIQVLAVHMADEALNRTEDNLLDMVTKAENDFNKPINDDDIVTPN